MLSLKLCQTHMFKHLVVSEDYCPRVSIYCWYLQFVALYVKITVHIWCFLSKMSKLLFTSSVDCGRCPKRCSYLKNIKNVQIIYIKSQKIVDFLHKLHYYRFCEYVEKTWKKLGKFGGNGDNLGTKFQSSCFVCPPLRHPAHAIPQSSRISRADWFSAPTFPSFA